MEYTLERYRVIKSAFRKRFSRGQNQPPPPSTAASEHSASHPTSNQPNGTLDTRSGLKSGAGTQAKRVLQAQPNGGTLNGAAVRARRRPLETAHARSKSSSAPATKSSTLPSGNNNPQPNHTRQRSQPEIWNPPPSAYNDGVNAGISTPTRPQREPSALPTPPADSVEIDEWRQYEPFPSAYPPTPLTHTATLPPPSERVGDGLQGISEEPGVVDEWRKYEPLPAAYPPTPLPSTSRLPSAASDRALGGILESRGSGKHAIDPNDDAIEDEQDDQEHEEAYYEDEDEEMEGIHSETLSEHDMEVDEDYDEDDYDEEEEDDFDITLQTPHPISRIRNYSSNTTSTDADPNDSTGLSTVDLGSPLRTRNNSEVSTLGGSDRSSVAGRKRTLGSASGPEGASENGLRKAGTGAGVKTVPKFVIKPKAVPTRTQVRPVRSRKPLASAAQDEKDGAVGVEGGDASSVAAKKRRVGSIPAGPGQQRPALSTRSVSDKTTSSTDSGPRRVKAGNTTTGATTSSRVPVRPVRRLTDRSTDSERTLGRNSRSDTASGQGDDGSGTIGRGRGRGGVRA